MRQSIVNLNEHLNKLITTFEQCLGELLQFQLALRADHSDSSQKTYEIFSDLINKQERLGVYLKSIETRLPYVYCLESEELSKAVNNTRMCFDRSKNSILLPSQIISPRSRRSIFSMGKVAAIIQKPLIENEEIIPKQLTENLANFNSQFQQFESQHSGFLESEQGELLELKKFAIRLELFEKRDQKYQEYMKATEEKQETPVDPRASLTLSELSLPLFELLVDQPCFLSFNKDTRWEILSFGQFLGLGTNNSAGLQSIFEDRVAKEFVPQLMNGAKNCAGLKAILNDQEIAQQFVTQLMNNELLWQADPGIPHPENTGPKAGNLDHLSLISSQAIDLLNNQRLWRDKSEYPAIKNRVGLAHSNLKFATLAFVFSQADHAPLFIQLRHLFKTSFYTEQVFQQLPPLSKSTLSADQADQIDHVDGLEVKEVDPINNVAGRVETLNFDEYLCDYVAEHKNLKRLLFLFKSLELLWSLRDREDDKILELMRKITHPHPVHTISGTTKKEHPNGIFLQTERSISNAYKYNVIKLNEYIALMLWNAVYNQTNLAAAQQRSITFKLRHDDKTKFSSKINRSALITAEANKLGLKKIPDFKVTDDADPQALSPIALFPATTKVNGKQVEKLPSPQSQGLHSPKTPPSPNAFFSTATQVSGSQKVEKAPSPQSQGLPSPTPPSPTTFFSTPTQVSGKQNLGGTQSSPSQVLSSTRNAKS